MQNLAETSLAVEKAAALFDPVAIAHSLVPQLSARAERDADSDRFVGENYALLKESGLVEAGVPAELGGGGADMVELAEMLRVLARACGSTALAFAMHTHQVAVPAWRWRHQNAVAVEPLLRRIAAERIILLSSGGSDWIAGSGKARKVDGGYRINARKGFTSGAEAGTLLMTGAVLEEADGGHSVIHFAAPMKAPEVAIEQSWQAMGMRGTGSHDVVIDDLFIADAGVAFKRNAGEWHPVFQVIATVAFPLIYAVYLGVAESARDIAVEMARKRPNAQHVASLAGRMDTALRAAQLAHRHMLDVAERNQPSAASVNEVMIGRTLVARHAIEATELAMEMTGGAAFFRKNGLERRFRDIQGARFHPMQPGAQAAYAGAMALGQDVARIF